MKTIPTMIAAALLLASVTATANTAHDVLLTSVAPTKAAAYELGLNKLSALKNSTSSQLGYTLNTPLGDVEDGSIQLKDGAYITVQERVGANGKVGYVGQVNVDVSYDMHDSDN